MVKRKQHPHPPEQKVRDGDDAARRRDPHGVGAESENRDGRAAHAPAGMPNDDRHATENAGNTPEEDAG